MRLTVTYMDGEEFFWHFGQKGDPYTWKRKKDSLIIKRHKGRGDRVEIPLMNVRMFEIDVEV